MKNALQGIPKFNVVVYLDDMILSSANKSDHVNLLDQVLDQLEKAKLRARKEKCEYFCKLCYLPRSKN